MNRINKSNLKARFNQYEAFTLSNGIYNFIFKKLNKEYKKEYQIKSSIKYQVEYTLIEDDLWNKSDIYHFEDIEDIINFIEELEDNNEK